MLSTPIRTHSNTLAACLLCLLMLVPPAYSQTAGISRQGTPLKKCWTSSVDGAETLAVLADPTTVYAATSDGELRALSIRDGSPAWTVEIGGEFVSNILSANGHLVMVSNTAGERKRSILTSISRQTGVAHWRTEVPYSDKHYLGGATPTGLVAVGSAGVVTGISLENGGAAWKADIASVVAAPSFRDGTILVGTELGRVYGIAQSDRGRTIYNIETKWKITAITFLNSGSFVIGDERGNVTAFGSDGSRDWTFKNGAGISHLIPTEKGILAASNDNFLYMLTENRGGVIWKRRLSGRVAVPPALMKETIFAVTYGDGRGYLLSIETGKIVDQTGPAKEFNPLSITTSQDAYIVIPVSTGITLYSPHACP